MNIKNISRYLILAGLWSLLLVPFYIANTMFFPYITGKNFAFRIIIEIVFALWVYLACIDVKYRPKLSWIVKTVGIFVVIMAVADFFSVNPMKAFWSNYERMDGWVTLIHMFMYLLVFGSMMKTEKIWLWFFRSSVAMSVIMVIFAINEWVTTGTNRVSTTLGNPIYVAVYFLFNFFFALILLYKDVIIKSAGTMRSVLSKWLTYIYVIAALLSAYGIWRTSTRGVILGLLGGLIITFLTIALFEKENKLMRKFSTGGLITIAIVIGGFFALKDTQFVKNDVTLERFAEISWNDVNGQGQARQLVWPMAIKGFFEKPILGWGQEGFNYVFNKYYDPKMYNQEQWFDRAHDTPLDMLVAGGILGLLSYLSIFIAALYLIWKRRNVLGVTDAGLLAGLLAGYFFQNIFVFDNLTSYMFFFIVLAYIHSRDTESVDVVAPTKNSPNQKKDMSGEIADYIVMPLLIIVLSVSIWYVNMRPINANLTLIQAMQGYQEGPSKNLEYFKNALSYNSFGDPEIREQLITIASRVAPMTNVDATLRQDFVNYAYQQMTQQLQETPNDARYQLFTGTFLNNINQYQAALPYLQKAIELSPAKQTMMFELQKAYSYTGQYDQALALAKKAYELEPDFIDAKYNYIAAAILNNNDTLVAQLWGNATSTTNASILQAYLIKASVFLQKGDKQSAIAQVQKDISIDPAFKDQGNSIIQQINSGTLK